MNSSNNFEELEIKPVSEELEIQPVRMRRILNEAAQQDEENCKKLISLIRDETGIGLTLLPKVLNLTDKKISTILVMYLTDKKTPRYLKATKKRKIKNFIEADLKLKTSLETNHREVLDLFLSNVDQDLWKKHRPANSAMIDTMHQAS